MPFALVPILLIGLPVIEIAVFIAVGQRIGLWPTLGFILLTTLVGGVLLRVQGLATVRRIQSELQRGRVPGRELGNGLMILLAGLLLLTPGFVTDALGFLLFAPVVRSALWRLVAARLSVQVVQGRWTPGPDDDAPYQGGKVIDLDADDFREHPGAGERRLR